VASFKFLHAADLHLDSPLIGLSCKSVDFAKRVETASRQAFDNLVRLAVEEKCRFVVLPGDVFDRDLRNFETGLFFAVGMKRLAEAGISVFLSLGNHDAGKGKRANGETESVARLSDGTRDQLFLAFRFASLESYGESAEPLPFVADDILVHFDGARARATLELLADFGKRNQMLLFTHEESVRDAAAELVKEGRANLVELPKAA
jgi:DNA repair exonuclease SbcCD nuclease subunit